MINRFWIAVLIFFVSFGVYRSNVGNLYTYDSAPASLFALNALEHRTLAFDDFRGGYIEGLGGGYAFTEAPNGHLEPFFPIGTALLATPVYAALYEIGNLRGGFPEITAPAFEPLRLRDEKRVANILAALAVALFFLCAIRIAAIVPALAATAAFAFGTGMWTIGSQALWQHGSIALVTLAMIVSLLANEARRSTVLAFVAGVCAGFLPVIRPTGIAYSLAGFAFVRSQDARRSLPFVLGAIVGAVPGLAWNIGAFHSIGGAYTENLNSYAFSIGQVTQAMSGLLVSPNRGLAIFTPLVFIAAIGAIHAFRTDDSHARLLRYLTLASIATFVNYVFFIRWEGGGTFGPRYLTDCAPTIGLLFLYAIPADVRRFALRERAVVACAGLLAFASIFVQFVGANGEPKTNWSGVPRDVSIFTERVWDWHDTQIGRDARATRYLFTANPTFPTDYANGFNGKLDTAIAFSDAGTAAAPSVRGGSTSQASVRVTNTGSVRWYGYQTGIYYGQVRVRVRTFDATGAEVHEEYLYVHGSPNAGESTVADGTLANPSAPGRYRVIADLDAFQDARIGSRHVGAQTSELDVTP
jgi:hypothetical protein